MPNLDDAIVRDLIDHLRTPAAPNSPKEEHGHALRLYLESVLPTPKSKNTLSLRLSVEVEVDLDAWRETYADYSDPADDAKGHIPELVREELSSRFAHIANGTTLTGVTLAWASQ